MSFGKKNAPRPGEKRGKNRVPLNVGATIILASGERIVCVVKDISPTSALLLVPTVLGIPAEFDLVLGDKPRRRVSVVRRATGKLAVRFA